MHLWCAHMHNHFPQIPAEDGQEKTISAINKCQQQKI